jgi:hypothetical protein
MLKDVYFSYTVVSGISSVGGLRTTGVFSGKLESARTFYSAVLYQNLLILVLNTVFFCPSLSNASS